MTVALITGASGGIGGAYADRLARRGHDFILVGRNQARLAPRAEACRAAGAAVDVMVADLTAPDDLGRVEQRLRDDPAIGMLVNAAGIATLDKLAGGDAEVIAAMIQTNVLALARLAATAAAAFAGRGGGTIINLSAVLALAPEIGNGAYAGSKAFVLALSQSLAREVGPAGVRVQAVLPGMTRTGIWRQSGRDPATLPASKTVTIPTLPDPADWQALEAARHRLRPHLSNREAAPRYRT
jgi:short-subunit dehydrogenase